MKLPDFNRAFQNGADFAQEGAAPFTVYTHIVGKLHLPSGKIVACDPLVFPDQKPYKGKVAPGTYPVLLSIARFRTKRNDRDERIACAMLRFTIRPAVKWKMALCPRQSLKALKADHHYGYAVDSGTGCFMDAQAGKALRREMDRSGNYVDNIVEAMKFNYQRTRDWTLFLIGSSEQTLAAFTTGWGDGRYGSYWGLDATGKEACLVTDFGVLP